MLQKGKVTLHDFLRDTFSKTGSNTYWVYTHPEIFLKVVNIHMVA